MYLLLYLQVQNHSKSGRLKKIQKWICYEISMQTTQNNLRLNLTKKLVKLIRKGKKWIKNNILRSLLYFTMENYN